MEDLPLEEFRGNTIIREEFEGNLNKQGRIWGNMENWGKFLESEFLRSKILPQILHFSKLFPRYLGEKGEIFTPVPNIQQYTYTKFHISCLYTYIYHIGTNYHTLPILFCYKITIATLAPPSIKF